MTCRPKHVENMPTNTKSHNMHTTTSQPILPESVPVLSQVFNSLCFRQGISHSGQKTTKSIQHYATRCRKRQQSTGAQVPQVASRTSLMGPHVVPVVQMTIQRTKATKTKPPTKFLLCSQKKQMSKILIEAIKQTSSCICALLNLTKHLLAKDKSDLVN